MFGMNVDKTIISIPKEFRDLQPLLETYVEARILEFAVPFAQHYDAAATEQAIERVALSIKASIPPPRLEEPAAAEPASLALVFRHDCRSLGCDDGTCELCMHNPCRKCPSNFAHKYLVEDTLIPKCEAPVWVEMVDTKTGKSVQRTGDLTLEVSILNGLVYDESGVADHHQESNLEEMQVLQNKELTPLLLTKAGGLSNSDTGKVSFILKNGIAQLPELYVTASSEALLSGRKPPFRLWIRPLKSCGENIKPAISEPFVVATKRVRTAGKVETPCVNDDVSKLKHMGKETVKKLKDLKESATLAGISLPEELTLNRVTKVREFQELSRFCESDPQLTMQLQSLLKLNKSRWKEACEHASQAVKPDNRMRIWYEDKNSMEVGLLFSCRLGNIDLDRPIGLLQKSIDSSGTVSMTATLTEQQTPGQREQVLKLKPDAIKSWWVPGHPGWAIHPADSETFIATGNLEAEAAHEFLPELSKDSVAQDCTSLVSPAVTTDPETPTGKQDLSEALHPALSSRPSHAPQSSPHLHAPHSSPLLQADCPFVRSTSQFSPEPSPKKMRHSISQSIAAHPPSAFHQVPSSSPPPFAFEANLYHQLHALSRHPVQTARPLQLQRKLSHIASHQQQYYRPQPTLHVPASSLPVGAPQPYQLQMPGMSPQEQYLQQQLARQLRQSHRHPMSSGRLPLASQAFLQEDLDAIEGPPDFLPSFSDELPPLQLSVSTRTMQGMGRAQSQQRGTPTRTAAAEGGLLHGMRGSQHSQQTSFLTATSSAFNVRDMSQQGTYSPSASPTLGLQLRAPHGPFSSPTSGQSEQTGGLRPSHDFITTATSAPDDLLDQLFPDQSAMDLPTTTMQVVPPVTMQPSWSHSTGNYAPAPTSSPPGMGHSFSGAVKRQRC